MTRQARRTHVEQSRRFGVVANTSVLLDCFAHHRVSDTAPSAINSCPTRLRRSFAAASLKQLRKEGESDGNDEYDIGASDRTPLTSPTGASLSIGEV